MNFKVLFMEGEWGSVGKDGTSQELLVGIMNAEGGPDALLKWFNHLLFTGDLPADWYKALMVVLPKTAAPSLPKELRPISLSSSVSRTFCRATSQIVGSSYWAVPTVRTSQANM